MKRQWGSRRDTMRHAVRQRVVDSRCQSAILHSSARPSGASRRSSDLVILLLGRAQPVIPPNLYSMLMNTIAWGPQVSDSSECGYEKHYAAQ